MSEWLIGFAITIGIISNGKEPSAKTIITTFFTWPFDLGKLICAHLNKKDQENI